MIPGAAAWHNDGQFSYRRKTLALTRKRRQMVFNIIWLRIKDAR